MNQVKRLGIRRMSRVSYIYDSVMVILCAILQLECFSPVHCSMEKSNQNNCFMHAFTQKKYRFRIM